MRTLPELTGSEKQIEWANDLRSRLIAGVEVEIERADSEKQIANWKRGLERILSAPCAIEAKFWIDTKGFPLLSLTGRSGYMLSEREITLGFARYTIPAAE